MRMEEDKINLMAGFCITHAQPLGSVTRELLK